ncbi:hypothetical protein BH23ACI1_BH23ACI1_33190 [soil metagenome]
MSLPILFLLLLVVLVAVAIPVAVFFVLERQEIGRPPLPPAPRPSAELVGVLKRWYADKSCAFCSHPVGPIRGEPRPGLLDRETHRALAWPDVAAAELPAALDRYEPVCASCFTAEAFRSLYPDRVVDRAPTPLRDSSVH